MKPATRAVLDHAQCTMPGCTAEHGPLFVHGKCHPGAGNEVEYENGVLHIRCRICKAPIIDIAVAERLKPPSPPRRRRP